MNWVGNFTSNIGSNGMQVCVICSHSNCTGYGLLDTNIHLKGSINNNDHFTGKYWSCNETGGFHFRLVDGGSSLETFSGWLTQSKTSATTFIYGYQINNLKPNFCSYIREIKRRL